MKILFTGTGSGKTSLNRFHSSMVIESENYRLLIDAGDGISKALLSAQINYNSISAILFTHMHPDHSAGLPSLMIQMKMAERDKDLFIFCHHHHKNSLIALLRHTLVLPERLKFNLRFITFSEGENVKATEGISFICRQNSHLADLHENLNADSDRVSCCFLLQLDKKNIFYTGDILREEDLYKFTDNKIDLIIAESTHIKMNLIIEAFNKSGAGKLYLTHISEEEKPGIKIPGVIEVYDRYEILL